MINLKDKTLQTFELDGKKHYYFSLKSLEAGNVNIAKLPYSIRVLLESVLRQIDNKSIFENHADNLAKWGSAEAEDVDVPFKPARVILQDFTGVPTLVDLASLRKAVADFGGDPTMINPEIPVDLVIDHSVQVDKFGTAASFDENLDFEFKRNEERYQFLNWAEKAFNGYRAVPPATGIVHQVNLEYLANVVCTSEVDGKTFAFPDSVFGTDSHTTMINGLGVLGWGVGGIEAEAGMLGQPSFFPLPEVIGVRFNNQLPNGATATDLALKVTEVLRKKGVVGKFVEFCGEGMEKLTLSDRATVANMAPEYGATCGFFPVDKEVLNYLRLTGRDDKQIALVETYCKANDLFYSGAEIEFTDLIEIDLAAIEPNLSGPKRPQDLIPLSKMKATYRDALKAPVSNQSFGLSDDDINRQVEITLTSKQKTTMKAGSIAIAAITSCTNTSNPYVMLSAGLVAKKAVEKGLKVPGFVKTSLAPGSKVVKGYLENAGLQTYLDQLGFNIVGYGCTTCIGNSGPLLPEIEKAIVENDLFVTSVLSGNRNFEGRIHPLVKANYLAAPPLVVAYALVGTVDIDFKTEAIGIDQKGNQVFLDDIWPTRQEIEALIQQVVTRELYKKEYAQVFSGNQKWNEIQSVASSLYNWDASSTYIQNPPYFENLSEKLREIRSLNDLQVIAYFGDSVTTDHISPAGSISKTSPAAKYLTDNHVDQDDFNSYGSRRGNHEVMMRGTFANIRIRNKIANGQIGGFTTYFPTNETMSIYDASMKYKDNGRDLIVIAGKDYGMGSSRDWAAKGTNLLGIKAVIAESFERIHRANLVLMGVLPLTFRDGENADTLGLTGTETFSIEIDEQVKPRQSLTVKATAPDGTIKQFEAVIRFESEIEIEYYRHGGILPLVLREKLSV